MLYHIITGQTAFSGGRAMSEVLADVREGRFFQAAINRWLDSAGAGSDLPESHATATTKPL